MDASKENHIWIELQKPRDEAHARQQCELANRMLSRLCEPGEMPGKFGYSPANKCYTFKSGFVISDLPDNGEWFNLDYFGREVKEAVKELVKQ